MAVNAWVGIGANLGNPIAAVREAIAALGARSACRILQASSLYRTAPVGPGTADQPDYINAVVRLETTLSAQALLHELFAIEEQFGRQRGARNAARTLDLDLLLYGEDTISLPGLIVPHPRMHERAFVLHPIAEVAPQTLVPGHGPVATLIAALDTQGIERLAD